MIEIKFRGMAVVSQKHNNIKVGDFVYGSYIESGCDAPCIIFGDGEQIEIDKLSLGQLLELKSGDPESKIKENEIYTGDVVRVTDGDGWVVGNHVCKMDGETLSMDNRIVGGVIGNIHQNTELLMENLK